MWECSFGNAREVGLAKQHWEVPGGGCPEDGVIAQCQQTTVYR